MLKERFRSRSLTDLAIITVMAAWIILAIVFGFTDLGISRAVVDRQSFWGGFGADFGEAPGYGIISAGLIVLLGGNMKKRNQNILGFLASAAGIPVCLVGIMKGSHDMTVLGASVTISMILLVALTARRNWHRYWRIALFITLLAIIVPLVSVQGLKILSGRVRFYDLASDFADYTPWYVFQGPILMNSSFPSGHTAMGWMLLPLLVLFRRGRLSGISKIIWTGIVLGWGLFVALSRVIIGAHYASDVLFSTGLAVLASYVLYRRLYGSDTGAGNLRPDVT